MASTVKQAADRIPDPAGAGGLRTENGLHINAATGLCTDYLNHFSEAIMLLEMLPAVPESVEDFLAWEPCGYAEHFASSSFKNRDAVIAAYKAANPALRQSLDELANSMNMMLLATREAMKSRTTVASTNTMAQCAISWVKPLVERAATLINAGVLPEGTEARAAQSAVDALFER
jgi:hypothetical protein